MQAKDEDVREWIASFNDEALLADGFDKAILGIAHYIGKNPIVAYDKDECIDILMKQFTENPSENDEDDADPYSDALEYFEYNVAGSYVGENTPIFIERYTYITSGVGPDQLEG